MGWIGFSEGVVDRSRMEGKEELLDENERDRTKREVRIGKRFAILGTILLLESILIAFCLISL